MNQDVRAILSVLPAMEGVRDDVITNVEHQLGLRFPDDYIDFLRQTNGTEGPTPNGGHVALWPLEELPAANEGYRVQDFAPGLLLFGSDGSGTAYGFATLATPMQVVALPFIPMDMDDIQERWHSFTDFLRSVVTDS